jgi:hypothetical protein
MREYFVIDLKEGDGPIVADLPGVALLKWNDISPPVSSEGKWPEAAASINSWWRRGAISS